jgi:hypothetical protein
VSTGSFNFFMSDFSKIQNHKNFNFRIYKSSFSQRISAHMFFLNQVISDLNSQLKLNLESIYLDLSEISMNFDALTPG